MEDYTRKEKRKQAVVAEPVVTITLSIRSRHKSNLHSRHSLPQYNSLTANGHPLHLSCMYTHIMGIQQMDIGRISMGDLKDSIETINNRDPKNSIETINNRDPKNSIETINNRDPKNSIEIINGNTLQ